MQSVLSKITTLRKKDPKPTASSPLAGSDGTEGQSKPDERPMPAPDGSEKAHLSLTKQIEPASLIWVKDSNDKTVLIGQGQYHIFKATVTILAKSKTVAVKAFREDDGPEDFEREVQIQCKMNHPCLLTLIGWCQKDNYYCLVMPLKKGGDLKHRRLIYDLATPLTLDLLLPILDDVLKGLRFLHSRQILHRDLKPENILLNKRRTKAVISDFGTTRQSAQAMTVFAVGTIEYTAPEIFHSDSYTSAVDIFSFGMIVWEALNRSKPWADVKGAAAMKIERKLAAGERPPLQESLDPLLRNLVTSCWAYAPEERPSADDLLNRVLPKIKEQLCPELLARSQQKPQLGGERGRGSPNSPDGRVNLAQSRAVLASDRNTSNPQFGAGWKAAVAPAGSSWRAPSPKPGDSHNQSSLPPATAPISNAQISPRDNRAFDNVRETSRPRSSSLGAMGDLRKKFLP